MFNTSLNVTIIKLGLWVFYKYRVEEHGIYYLFGLTDSYYPRIFSFGYYCPEDNKIVIALVGNWELRLEHEKGHSRGLKHVPLYKVGYVMHPWSFLRGKK